jgi:peptide methionine sulfoxide reductase MsrB
MIEIRWLFQPPAKFSTGRGWPGFNAFTAEGVPSRTSVEAGRIAGRARRTLIQARSLAVAGEVLAPGTKKLGQFAALTGTKR